MSADCTLLVDYLLLRSECVVLTTDAVSFQARKQLTISQAPPVLVLQLKRFTNMGMHNVKINKDISFRAGGAAIEQLYPHNVYLSVSTCLLQMSK